MNYKNLVICGEVNGNETVKRGVPYHLSLVNGKVIADSFFSDATIHNICYNTDEKFLRQLAEEHADLKVIDQRKDAVAFALSNLKPDVKPRITSWNA